MVEEPPGAARGNGNPDGEVTPTATDPQRELTEPAPDYEAAQLRTGAHAGAYLIENRIDDTLVRPPQIKT
jgi:hypothetical protein